MPPKRKIPPIQGLAAPTRKSARLKSISSGAARTEAPPKRKTSPIHRLTASTRKPARSRGMVSGAARTEMPTIQESTTFLEEKSVLPESVSSGEAQTKTPHKRKTPPTQGRNEPPRKSARQIAISSDTDQHSLIRGAAAGKRKRQSAAQHESNRPQNHTQAEEEIPASTTGTSDPISHNPSKCFRISNVPTTWNRGDLLETLQNLDLLPQELDSGDQLSLYPDCFDPSSSQTALLYFKQCPESFLRLPPNGSSRFQASDKKSGEVVDLSIDSQFYSLTPLNVPGEEVVAE
jgi:hypothetical protein